MAQVDRIAGLTGTLGVKAPVRVASVTNLTLSGTQTIDGVAVVSGDRVLAAGQTDPVDNGIWEVSTGSWTRAPDFDGTRDVMGGTVIVVAEGGVYTGALFRISSTGDLTPGTNSISFVASLFTWAASIAASLVTFTQNVTGAIQRTLFVKLNENISVKDFGATGDGTTDDTAAINLAIAAINAGTVRCLRIPAGNYRILSALTAITADNWAIIGDGHGSSRLFIGAGSGTLSNFFTIGSGAAQAENWYVHGLWLENENTATMGSTNPLVVTQGTNGRITDIYCRNTPGLITMGTATTVANRIRVTGWEVRAYGPVGGTIIDIQRMQACTFSDGLAVEITGTASNSLKGIHIHPASATALVDSCRWTDLEFNFPNTLVDEIVVLDATNGLIINQWFNNCTFDHALSSCIKLLIGAAAIGSARINNVGFNCCRATADDFGPVVLTNDKGGANTIHNVEFNGGTLITWDSPCVRITQTTQDIHASFIGVALHDGENVTTKSAIESNLGNIRVIGCIAQANAEVSTCTFDYGVKFTGAATEFNVSGNDFDAVTIADVYNAALTVGGQKDKYIRDNIAPAQRMPARAQTTDATVTNLASQALNDASVYHVRAVVVGVKSDGTQRASYEIVGTFYRTAAGNATQQGATTVVHSIESDAAWACAFAVTGNNVVVTVTGVAATTINWAGKMEFDSVTEA